MAIRTFDVHLFSGAPLVIEAEEIRITPAGVEFYTARTNNRTVVYEFGGKPITSTQQYSSQVLVAHIPSHAYVRVVETTRVQDSR